MRKFVLLALCVVSVGSANAVFFDDFNRPDAPNLGPNWQVIGTASATRVISNQAGNVAGANNLSLVTPGNYSDSYTNTAVSADIFHSGVAGTGFVALAFGHNGSSAVNNGLYIKVQTQGTATQFSNIGFYTGVGQSGAAAWTGGANFFTLTAAEMFSSARITVWASDPTTINLGIDTNFNGGYEMTFTRTLNTGLMTFGNQVGIGVFGTNSKADNFNAVPEPATMAALGLGVVALIRRRRR